MLDACLHSITFPVTRRLLVLFGLVALMSLGSLGIACSGPAQPLSARTLAKTEAGRAGNNPSLQAPVYGPAFWQHWGDGQAELASYDLQIRRYGEDRKGVATAIFVTEPFLEGARVKADSEAHSKADRFSALKLNLVRDFSTGIYDYNLMTSVFLALEPAASGMGLPAKVSFSSQEWCGHLYHQLLFDQGRVRETLHSYFEGEADRNGSLEVPAQVTSEDALWLWARDLASPALEAGETATVNALLSLASARLNHREVSVSELELSVALESETIEVPAGTFETRLRTARPEAGDGPTWRFWVEVAPPHRIIRWSSRHSGETLEADETAELLGSERLPYWRLHDEASRPLVRKLGLTPRGERMP